MSAKPVTARATRDSDWLMGSWSLASRSVAVVYAVAAGETHHALGSRRLWAIWLNSSNRPAMPCSTAARSFVRPTSPSGSSGSAMAGGTVIVVT